MLDRHLTWIDGPGGAGKTTLIERVLQSNRAKIVAALRVIPDAGIAAPVFREADEASDEVARWQEAGAPITGTLRVPEGWPEGLYGALEECDNATSVYVAEVLLIEGPLELSGNLHDTSVYVTQPLPVGEAVVVEETREVMRVDGMTALRLLAAARAGEDLGQTDAGNDAPDTPAEELPEGMRPGDIIDEETGEVVVDAFEIPDELGHWLVKVLEEGVPSKQHKHWLHRSLEGLADAKLAIVNAHSAADKGPAQRLVDELHALRRDEPLRREALGWKRGPRVVRAANLEDRRDDGTRKVIEAIKRRWRSTLGPAGREFEWDDTT